VAIPGESAAELHRFATQYGDLSKDDLLVELQLLVQPAQYKDTPDRNERRREGEALWIAFRRRLANLICRNRTPGASAQLNTLMVAGSGAFIDELGAQILGSGVIPHVTVAIAAALAGLLYTELQHGIDYFCSVYYEEDD
jgi:hypothetical protein